MKRLLLAVLIACSDAWSEDLGKIAPTYPIAERDLASVFQERVAKAVANGAWQREMDRLSARTQAYAEAPPGVRLPRAMVYRSHYYDPTYTLVDKIVDQNQRVMWPKGTTINPLDHIRYSKALCFFDASDARQVDWIKARCLDPVSTKAIAVNGPVMKLMETLDAHLYFDQHGLLAERFGIRALPSLVRQTGNQFVIEEFPL